MEIGEGIRRCYRGSCELLGYGESEEKRGVEGDMEKVCCKKRVISEEDLIGKLKQNVISGVN